MIQSSRLQQRKLQHGKEMVIAVKKSSKKVILAVVIVLGILVLDAWRSGKIKWYTLDEQEMSQTASDTKSVKITKQTSSRQKKQKKVRVLLSTTGFTSLYHDKVCVSGTKGLQVRKGNHKVTYSAKEQVTFLVKEDGKDSRDKITIQPKDGGKITVHSIKRQNRTPSYRGEITLLPKKNGFLVKGLFDVNPKLKGVAVRGILIRMTDELPAFLQEHDIQIAALTLPKQYAKEMADFLVDHGIRAIWNFAHTDLHLPEDVIIENVHLSESLMQLSYNISRYSREHK